MKKQNKPIIIKISERFDQQLFNILSKELSALKRSTKDHIIKTLKPVSEELQIA